MKKRMLFVFIFFAVLLSGCVEGMQSGDNGNIADGRGDTGIFIEYALSGLTVKSSVDESLIDDMNIYVANEDGDVVAYKYCTGKTLFGRDGRSCRIDVDIQKGVKYSIYAVANAGREIPLKSAGELDACVYVDSDVEKVIAGSRPVLMSGFSSQLYLTDGQTVVVNLERCVSKISVRADYSGLNEDVIVSINSIALKNIPDRVSPFGESRISEPEHALEGVPVCGVTDEELLEGILFYQYENRQGTLHPGNTDYTKKVWPQESIYSKICSYVEMKGSYSSPRKKGDIVYRFYLGSDMVSNYDVLRNTEYRVVVNFNGDGAVDENTWRVDNSAIEDVVTEIAFRDEDRVMYDGEIVKIPYHILSPSDAQVEVSLDNGNAQILEADNTGITVKAITPGACTITASAAGASDTCLLDIRKLAIVPALSDIVLYNGFYDDVLYTVVPEHASGLKVNVSASSDEIAVCYDSVPNRVMPHYDDQDFPFPQTATLTFWVDGRPEVCSEVCATIKPSIAMRSRLELNANIANTSSDVDLQIDTHPRAGLSHNWTGARKPEDISFNAENGTVELAVPAIDNGEYKLSVSVCTDYDNRTPVSEECVIAVYETVWLVGVSRGSERETVVSNSIDNVFIYRYHNEIMAEWLAHPSSRHFPEGMVNYASPFCYKGVQYSPEDVCGVESYQFAFNEGSHYEYAFGKGHFVFNGSNAPYQYIDFYLLEPCKEFETPVIDGVACKVIPTRFGGGFADKDASWEDVFDVIY